MTNGPSARRFREFHVEDNLSFNIYCRYIMNQQQEMLFISNLLQCHDLSFFLGKDRNVLKLSIQNLTVHIVYHQNYLRLMAQRMLLFQFNQKQTFLKITCLQSKESKSNDSSIDASWNTNTTKKFKFNIFTETRTETLNSYYIKSMHQKINNNLSTDGT